MIVDTSPEQVFRSGLVDRPLGVDLDRLEAARLGDELTATAEERSRSKRTGVYDVVVRNKQGESVALFRGRSHELGGSITTEP